MRIELSATRIFKHSTALTKRRSCRDKGSFSKRRKIDTAFHHADGGSMCGCTETKVNLHNRVMSCR